MSETQAQEQVKATKAPAKAAQPPAKVAQYIALATIIVDNVQYAPDQLVPESEHTERLLKLEVIKPFEAQ